MVDTLLCLLFLLIGLAIGSNSGGADTIGKMCKEAYSLKLEQQLPTCKKYFRMDK